MIRYSESESNIAGYQIARGDKAVLKDVKKMKSFLEENSIDILKLSIDNPDPDLYLNLDNLGYHYYTLDAILKYKCFFIRNPKVKPYLHKNVSFVNFTNDQSHVLWTLLNDIFNKTTSFFNNPILKNIEDYNKQMLILFNYIKTYSTFTSNNRYTHIMYHDNEPIGFVSSYMDEEGAGGGVVYAGIIPKYVGKGFYLDLVRFIQNFGKEIGQKWGYAHAQIHHTVVQKTFIREGLIPVGHSLNIHVNSCLGNFKSLNKF